MQEKQIIIISRFVEVGSSTDKITYAVMTDNLLEYLDKCDSLEKKEMMNMVKKITEAVKIHEHEVEKNPNKYY